MARTKSSPIDLSESGVRRRFETSSAWRLRVERPDSEWSARHGRFSIDSMETGRLLANLRTWDEVRHWLADNEPSAEPRIQIDFAAASMVFGKRD